MAGSYEALVGGHSSLALMVMTGCEDLHLLQRDPKSNKWTDSRYYPNRKKSVFEHGLVTTRSPGEDSELSHDELWARLTDYDLKNYPMSCSISGDEVEKERSDGLVERHAYALISAVEVAGFKMICARNPWGNDKEWNGDFSDGSERWAEHPELRAALEFEPGDDGKFWMDFEDFTKTFTGVEACCQTQSTDRASHDVHYGTAAAPSVFATPPSPPDGPPQAAAADFAELPAPTPELPPGVIVTGSTIVSDGAPPGSGVNFFDRSSGPGSAGAVDPDDDSHQLQKRDKVGWVEERQRRNAV